MTLDLNLAMISGALMFLGYALYIGLTLKKDVEPNPTTWLMFAYGTVLLTILELDRLGWDPQALMGVLVVPIACSISGIVVALICLRRGTLRWPSDWEDRVSFITDLVLTAGYVTAGVLLAIGYIVPEQREFASLLFLICSNLTAITAFVPILRHTRRDPSAERSWPWIIWTLSYITLGALTYLQYGLWTELMIYPALNAVLHLSVGLLSLPHRRQKKLEEGFLAF